LVQLNFYTTIGCHLCDDAKQLLEQIKSPIKINEIEIADDDALIEQYGTLIPVVTIQDTEKALNWPFTLMDIQDLIKQQV